MNAKLGVRPAFIDSNVIFKVDERVIPSGGSYHVYFFDPLKKH